MTRLHRVNACVSTMVALAVVLLYGCGGRPSPTETAPATGGVPQRIVSIAPSVTEILFSVGAGERVVAVDDYSDYPPEADALPSVGGVVLNVEKIAALKPDLVLGVEDLQGASLERLRRLGLDVLAIDTTSYERTVEAIRRVGAAVGREGAAQALARRMEEARADARQAGEYLPDRSVLFVAQAAPSVIVAGEGTFQDDLLNIIDVRNAAPLEGFGALSRETMATLRPDLVLVGSDDEAAAMRRRFRDLPGPDPRVTVMPEDILVRPGPRLPDGLMWLVETLDEEGEGPKP